MIEKTSKRNHDHNSGAINHNYIPQWKIARKRQIFLLPFFVVPFSFFYVFRFIDFPKDFFSFNNEDLSCFGILLLCYCISSAIYFTLLYFFYRCSKCGRLIYSTDENKRWFPRRKYLTFKKCENCGHPFRFWFDEWVE